MQLAAATTVAVASRSNCCFQLLQTSSDRVSIIVNVDVPVEARDHGIAMQRNNTVGEESSRWRGRGYGCRAIPRDLVNDSDTIRHGTDGGTRRALWRPLACEAARDVVFRNNFAMCAFVFSRAYQRRPVKRLRLSCRSIRANWTARKGISCLDIVIQTRNATMRNVSAVGF